MAAFVVLKNASVRRIEIERDNEIAKLNKEINILNISLGIQSKERSVLKKENKELSDKARMQEAQIVTLSKIKLTIPKSTANLSNDALIVEANKEFGGDTTGVKLTIPRTTTEYLVETSKEYKILSKQFELSLELNNNYKTQLLNDSIIFRSYENTVSTYKSVVVAQDKQIEVSNEAFKQLKKVHRRTKAKVVVLAIAGAVGTYYLLK